MNKKTVENTIKDSGFDTRLGGSNLYISLNSIAILFSNETDRLDQISNVVQVPECGVL